MAALKALVIGMGVLIVLCVAGLGYMLVQRMRAPEGGADGTILALPAGGKVVDMAGVGNRLVLRVATPDHSERLLLVDPAQGRVVGTMMLGAP
jgi:hypothetical protein